MLQHRSAFFVTVLREPLSHMTSVFNWYRPHYDWASLDDFIDYLATTPEEQHRPRHVGRHLGIARNFQARDLGFYEAGGRAESSSAEVESWIKSLSAAFSYPSSGLVVINERYDEGLVLLQQALKVELEDVAYRAMRVQDGHGTKYEEPTARQSRRILGLASVDVQLYDYFNRSFASLWDDNSDSVRATLEETCPAFRGCADFFSSAVLLGNPRKASSALYPPWDLFLILLI